MNFQFTEILAGYAAILSTSVFIWNVVQSKGKVRVRVVYGTERVDDEYVAGVLISVQNPSSKPVHITNISILYPFVTVRFRDRIAHIWRFKRFPWRIGWCSTSLSNLEVDSKCPVTIDPGKSHRILIPMSCFDSELSKAIRPVIIAKVQDALWRNVLSRPFVMSITKDS